jgi:hypothetical protein
MRALDALAMGGQLGGQIRGQDWHEASQRAAAQDAINQANWANSQGIMNANVDNKNNANMFNLQNQQNVNMSNVDLRNQATNQNSQIENQRFNNDLAKATGQANAQQGVTNQYNNQANRMQQLGGMGVMIGGEMMRNTGNTATANNQNRTMASGYGNNYM